MPSEEQRAKAAPGASPADGAAPGLERGTYELLRERLLEQGRRLGERAEVLNRARQQLFGQAEMCVLATARVRTENNCVPRDIAGVGRHLLLGFNVFVGLRSQVAVEDVFSAYRLVDDESGPRFEPEDLGALGLSDSPQFARDFAEIYAYYRDATLAQLRLPRGKLLAVFQTGRQASDRKVFRWRTSGETLEYVDNAGLHDHVFPPSHEFEWIATTRDDHIDGRNPHVSILDEVFVEAISGDLTIKVENNTETGEGIFAEPVDDPNQSLEDAELFYARVGALILIRIRPYHEDAWRHLVFNPRTKSVVRIDAIEQACVELPESHGIVFPGGYYLQTGETKTFTSDVSGMVYMRKIRSPNGEDVLYVFYARESGRYILLAYNAIRRELANPIHCNGYCVYEDGRMVVFRANPDEPTRVHAMQIWQTPFMSAEHAARAPSTGSFLESVGNADLVRGISDALSLGRLVEQPEPLRETYEDIISATTRLTDQYHWLGHGDVALEDVVREIASTAETAIGEFEKVRALREKADASLREAESALDATFASLAPDTWDSVEAFVSALAKLRRQRGELIAMRDLRYVDRERIDELELAVAGHAETLSGAVVEYLLEERALAPYVARAEACASDAEASERQSELEAVAARIEALEGELDVLHTVVASLEIADKAVRTEILEDVAEVLGSLNRCKAVAASRRKELLAREGGAEFAAEWSLFSQAVTTALGSADTTEKCDVALSRLMVQIEDLEARFSEFDAFLEKLVEKREDVYEAFSSRKQSLLDARQRQADQAMKSAERVLTAIARRAQSLGDPGELHAYFAADPMVGKARELAGRLRALADDVRADEVEGRLKSAKEDAARGLRDRQDLYEDGANVIRLGKHRFSVNRQPLDLTLVPRDGEMVLHLTGTDFYAPVEDAAFQETRAFWDQSVISETREVYRGEFLAVSILQDAARGDAGPSVADLQARARAGTLATLVREVAAERYDEGYERGLHDADAARILEALLGVYSLAGLLRFEPGVRALAVLFWAHLSDPSEKLVLERRAQSLGRLRAAFDDQAGVAAFASALRESMARFFSKHAIEVDARDLGAAATYLFEELSRDAHDFVLAGAAAELSAGLREHLRASGGLPDFEEDLRALENDLAARLHLARAWVAGYLARSSPGLERGGAAAHLDEVAVALITERSVNRHVYDAATAVRVEGLLGQHRRIEARAIELHLDEVLARIGRFRACAVPAFRSYLAKRNAVVERAREELRISEFKPRVMTSFVRNQLIDTVYLPIIGDNLAKQMGASGDDKRTDLMGLLLLISPPGYGKTTLMEYIADRLGLVFVKVNGPALGHQVTSLDPAQAPNAGARQEIVKLNFALEMGNNVLLYLDDIQHTSSELLQKFISLCDGQRRMEGVFRGQSRTYDLRGKKFCVCMAGNPYTESGETFEIPDMLANRADIYNVGDILSGKDEVFALSYIENGLTSNDVLRPLSTRDLADVRRIVKLARGEGAPAEALSHPYSTVELEEILAVMRHLLRVQQVLLAVNRAYIQSAQADDAYRTEPAFKLQGSYRNMNKIAEKVVAVMTPEELERLIDDHYQGEAQTLTTSAEHNLLKLRELRGVQTEAERARWQEILRDFQRVKLTGGAGADDPVARVTGHLGLLSERLEEIRGQIEVTASALADAPAPRDGEAIRRSLEPFVQTLREVLARLEQSASSGRAAGAPELEAGLEAIAARIAEAFARGGPSGIGPEGAAALAGIEAALSQLAERVAAFAAPDPAAPGEARAEAGGLAPYLDKLDETLRALAKAPRGGEIVQALGPGVRELLETMTRKISDLLIPTLHKIERRAELRDDDRRLKADVNRTLKNFDMLKDLLEALQKIDTRDLSQRLGPPEARKSAKRGETND